jgi:hypothetical protein
MSHNGNGVKTPYEWHAAEGWPSELDRAAMTQNTVTEQFIPSTNH